MLLSTLEDLKSISNILKTSFNETSIIAELLTKTCSLTNSNSLLVDRTGVILHKDNNILNKGSNINQTLVNQLANLDKPLVNCNLDYFDFNNFDTSKDRLQDYCSIIYPININYLNIATLILYKKDKLFNGKCQIIVEHVASLISVILSHKNNKKIKDFENNRNIVKAAISTLSFSELDAIIHVFNQLNQNEGLVVASKIADKFGISRSIIINAFRKLESAGIFETRSLGMKGTYIKIINNQFINEINKLNNN